MSAEQPIPVDSRKVIIPADKVTPQMRANAMFSPDNIHPGALKPAESLAPSSEVATEVIGSTVTGSLVELDIESVESNPSNG